ncbi:MAG: hypothetical protein QG655_3246 [Actinomycetota bacterium]|nr:hypothetical protein [Actinomycetota bacterium]HPY23555.1 hypothetical protein [Mycobacterium sp.]
MLVDVVSVLKMPVSVMDVVNMAVVRDLLAVVVIGMRCPVPGVNLRLRVALSVVDVVYVVAVDNGLVPVAWQVLMVAGFAVLCRWHFHSLGARAYRSAVIDLLRY